MWKLLCGSSHFPVVQVTLLDGIRGQRCNFHIPHHTKDRYLFVVTLYKMCSSTYLCLSLQLGLKKYDVYTVKLCLEVANTGWSCKKKQRDKTFLNQKFIQIVFTILLEQCLKFQPSWTVCYVDNFLFQRRRIFFCNFSLYGNFTQFDHMQCLYENSLYVEYGLFREYSLCKFYVELPY